MAGAKRNVTERTDGATTYEKRLLTGRDHLKHIFQNAGIEPTEARLVFSSYMLWVLLQALSAEQIINTDYLEAIEIVFPPTGGVREIAANMMNGEVWKEIRTAAEYMDKDVCKGLVLYRQPGTPEVTPQGVSLLAAKLLGITPNDRDRVADLCCGTGGFMLEAGRVGKAAVITAYERNQDSAFAAQLRAWAAGCRISVFVKDVFSRLVYDGGVFDKVFCHPNFRSRVFEGAPESDFAQEIAARYHGVKKLLLTDWLFAVLAAELLAKDGKAICILPVGALRSKHEKDIRKDLVDKGLLETVITLPPKVLPKINTAVSVVVLSQGNQRVRMVDAVGYKSQGRRVITADDVEEIYKASLEPCGICRDVESNEMAARDYSLYPGQYFTEQVTAGIHFKLLDITILKDQSIVRGVHWTQKDFLRLETQEETGIHYVNVNNVNDGMIDEKLPCLRSLDEKYKPYCAADNALLISKVGWKTAVVKLKEGEELLVSNNFFIVEIDESKVDPYYLQAYLESPEGRQQLKSKSSGGAREFITVKVLKDIEIPLLTIKEQKAVVNRFKAALKAIRMHRDKLRDAREKMKHAFETEGQD